MNKQEEIGKYKVGQKVAIHGYIDAIDIENASDIENTTTLRIKTPIKTISINPKYEEVVTDLNKSKPVVPPCIDRWIQGCKYNGFDLLEAMTMSFDMPEETGRWINDNPETFSKAWLYDYEVEKEKLYTVELPIHNGPFGFHYVLSKNKEGEIVPGSFYKNNWRKYDCCQLTEAEIKKEHEWAWKYSEEVIEDE